MNLVQRTRTSDLLEARRDETPKSGAQRGLLEKCQSRAHAEHVAKRGRVSDETVEPAVGLTREGERSERGGSGAACSKENQWPSRVEEEEVRPEVRPKSVALTQLALLHAHHSTC